MERKQRIIDLLKNDLDDFNIDITDNSHLHVGHNEFNGLGETHLLIELKSKSKKIINRLEIHKKINSLIKREFERGLHSVEIKIN